MKKNETVCSHCGCMIENDEQYYVGDDVLCQVCYDHLCTCCDHCGHSIYLEDAITDDYSALCSACYHAHYIRCDDCNCIIAAADSYELHGYDPKAMRDTLSQSCMASARSGVSRMEMYQSAGTWRSLLPQFSDYS